MRSICKKLRNKIEEAMKKFVTFVALMVLTGCASLTMDRQQPFTVQTNHEDAEVTGIACAMQNDEGTWFVTSPASATVHKSAGDLIVDCKNDRIAGNAIVSSTVNAAYLTNFLFLFGIGYIVDRYTGAGFDYPTTIVVKLNPMKQ
jgi:hypothetical protein